MIIRGRLSNIRLKNPPRTRALDRITRLIEAGILPQVLILVQPLIQSDRYGPKFNGAHAGADKKNLQYKPFLWFVLLAE